MKKFLSSVLALAISVASFACTAPQQSEESAHPHPFGEWSLSKKGKTCEESTFVRACTECSATEERKGTKEDHVWSVEYDLTHHSFICDICKMQTEKQPHAVSADETCRDCKELIPSAFVNYELSEDGSYAIATGYREEDMDTDFLVVSPLYNGVPVQEIANSAFEGCTRMLNATLPNSITRIGNNAFKDCKYLMGIYLFKGVTYVGDNAFDGCLELSIFYEEKTIPSAWSDTWNSSKCNVYRNRPYQPMQPVSMAATQVIDSVLWELDEDRKQILFNRDTNDVLPPMGFTHVKRFDGKNEGIGAWKSSALWNYNFDNRDMSDYAELWFAIKVENGFWAFVDNATQGVESPWVYIYMKQTGRDLNGDILWTVQASFGGQTHAVNENQVSAHLDKDRPANSIPRLMWDEAFSSPDKKAFLIYHKNELDFPPTVYCTEVIGIRSYN